jgi:two-component system LytT family response regulator
MTPPRALIVDDEPLARRRLARLLQECGWEVVRECCHVPELLAALEQDSNMDALFLDLEMPGASGMEALAEIPSPLPVIFVTAHPQHAAKAFDVDAPDYLVKAVFRKRLEQALDKLSRRTTPSDRPGPAAGTPLRFPAKAAGGTFFLDPRRVTHFEFEDHAVLAWVGGKPFRSPWGSLSEVESALGALNLLRIQRHLLIRQDSVLSIRTIAKGRIAVRIVDGPELEVSRNMTPRVKALMGLGKG